MSILIKGMDMPREDGTYVFAINISNGCAECVYWLKEDGGVSYRVVEVPTEQPTADVAPVVHGRWKTGKSGMVVCSNCNFPFYEIHFRFCPRCGAKMDLQ